MSYKVKGCLGRCLAASIDYSLSLSLASARRSSRHPVLSVRFLLAVCVSLPPPPPHSQVYPLIYVFSLSPALSPDSPDLSQTSYALANCVCIYIINYIYAETLDKQKFTSPRPDKRVTKPHNCGLLLSTSS